MWGWVYCMCRSILHSHGPLGLGTLSVISECVWVHAFIGMYAMCDLTWSTVPYQHKTLKGSASPYHPSFPSTPSHELNQWRKFCCFPFECSSKLTMSYNLSSSASITSVASPESELCFFLVHLWLPLSGAELIWQLLHHSEEWSARFIVFYKCMFINKMF